MPSKNSSISIRFGYEDKIKQARIVIKNIDWG